MEKLANKIALVTGGSRGLGKDMVQQLAAAGASIIFTYKRNAEAARSVQADLEARGVRAAALQLDTAQTDTIGPFIAAVKEVLARWEHTQLDLLVNNAGVGIHAPLAETTEAQFDLLMNIHFKSTFFLTQGLLPLLADGGVITNISTGLARFSLPGYGAYAAMKGAIETLTRYQAKELGARGIRVNVVAPGAIATDFGGGVVRDNQDVNGFISSQTALGRVGEAHDIGSVVTFLATDDAKWVTGQRIEVSGGMFL